MGHIEQREAKKRLSWHLIASHFTLPWYTKFMAYHHTSALPLSFSLPLAELELAHRARRPLEPTTITPLSHTHNWLVQREQRAGTLLDKPSGR